MEALGARLPSVLAQRLRYADVEEVAALVLIQYSRGGFSVEDSAPTGAGPGVFEERVAALLNAAPGRSYVKDCELIAEYRQAGPAGPRNSAIREEFRRQTSRSIRFYIEVLLEGRGISAPGDAAVEELRDGVQARLFGEAEFGSLASSYRPGRGMTFERYLLRKAFWLAQDRVAQYAREEPVRVPISAEGSREGRSHAADLSLAEVLEDPEAVSPLHAASSAEETARRLREARERLGELFGWLESRGADARKRLLPYLIYKAYVEPEMIPAGLLELVEGGMAPLQREYLAAQEDLMVMRERLLEAGEKLRVAAARPPSKAEELRGRFGAGAGELNELEQVARKSLIGELEEELRASDPGKEHRWVCEVEYMLAWKRHADARKSYEQWLEKLESYLRCRKPWIRSQRELARLRGAPQGTIGREMAELRRELNAYRIGREGEGGAWSVEGET
jgi:hypothetical protein